MRNRKSTRQEKPYYLADEKLLRPQMPRLSGRGLYWNYHVPETLRQRISAAIQFRRVEMHMTQAGFAEMVGMSLKFLNQIESNRNTPSLEMLEEMVGKMGLRPEDFFLMAAQFVKSPPILAPRAPVTIKSIEKTARQLEGLVGVLDGFLDDIRTRVDSYYEANPDHRC